MTEAAKFSITIDGTLVTANFEPLLISMTITDSDGGKSDTLEITLDDSGGAIQFPRTGATIQAQIWRPSEGRAVSFTGKTDEPKSKGSRHGGREMTITAKSADMKGEGKHKTHRHADNKAFKDVAQDWGQQAGFTVTCDAAIGATQRGYWSMSNESFFGWGQRIAEEIGATFKVSGTQAVFVARDSGSSAGGTALATVTATFGDNLIEWDMAPVQSRAEYESSKVRWYDSKGAAWMEEDASIDADNSD